MVISLAQKLHSSCSGEFLEALQHFRRETLELLYHSSCEAVGYPEFSATFIYQLEHRFVRRKIAFARDFPAHFTVLSVIEIVMVCPYVEYWISSEPERLMDLEIEADVHHCAPPFSGIPFCDRDSALEKNGRAGRP